MARRKTLSDLTSASRSQRAKKRRTVRVNGKNINRDTQPEAYQIATSLRDSGIATNNTLSLNEKAKILLEEICWLSSEQKDFSLIENCGDDENIDNENIIDKEAFENTTATTISADDKFIDANDPFYNLDGDDVSAAVIQEYEDQKVANESDYISLTVNLLGGNGKTTATTNGQTTSNAVSTSPPDTATTTTSY